MARRGGSFSFAKRQKELKKAQKKKEKAEKRARRKAGDEWVEDGDEDEEGEANEISPQPGLAADAPNPDPPA